MQNTIFRISLFQIQCFESLTCSLGEPKKIICWTSQQRNAQSIFRVIFCIRIDIIITIIMQNTIFRINLFQIQCFESLTCSLEEPKKKSVEPHSREQNRAYLELSFEYRFGIITPVILQNIIFADSLLRIENFNCWMCPFGEPKKKSVEPRSRKHSGAYSELSFELGSTLSLQWFCKIAFSELAYIKLKVLVAERVPLES